MRKKYLHRIKGYVYFRKGGKYVRIHAPEGTPEFDREYWEIMTGRRAEAKTSWRVLIDSYRTSDRWTKLKPRTRADYEAVLVYLVEKIGTRDVARLVRKDVIAAQAANAHRTRFANYIPQVMSVLCEHAIDLGWRSDNPAKGVRALSVPEDRRRPHRPWTDAAVEKMRAEGRPLPRLIFELGVGSVQRPGDLPKFRWGDYDGDALRIRQGKTDKELLLPCTKALRSALEEAKAALGGAPHPRRTIIASPQGRALTYRRMAELFRAERERLGLTAFDMHALRYRGVKELAWAGCSDDEIASYSGHSTIEMIRKYAGEARQEMRARQAREKRR